jgi:hypothetical protein
MSARILPLSRAIPPAPRAAMRSRKASAETANANGTSIWPTARTSAAA